MEDQIAGHSPAQTDRGRRCAGGVARSSRMARSGRGQRPPQAYRVAGGAGRGTGCHHLAGHPARGCAGAAVRAACRRPLAGPHSVQHARRQQGALRPRRRHRPGSFDRRHDRGDAHRHDAAHSAGPGRQERCAGERNRSDRRRRSISPRFRCRNSGPATAAAISAPATSP